MRQAVRAIIIRDDKILLIHRNKFGQEYYTLPGGGIDPGESPEQALRREITEETGFTLTSLRLVFTESQGAPYGTQRIFLCEAAGDEPALGEDTEEFKISALGKNLHTPLWFEIAQVPEVTFRTPELRQAVLLGIKHGFPEHPAELTADYLEKIQAKVHSQKG